MKFKSSVASTLHLEGAGGPKLEQAAAIHRDFSGINR
jgi:hypothetical protein